MTLAEIKELAGHRVVSPWVVKLVQEAVELEREACAKVCDEEAESWNEFDYACGEASAANKCAAAIRARGVISDTN